MRIEPAIAAGPVAVSKQGDILGSINSMAFPQPLLYAALGGYASNTGVPVTPFTALQSAAVYGCTKCISEDIAGLPLQVRRRTATGGWVVDTEHPLNTGATGPPGPVPVPLPIASGGTNATTAAAALANLGGVPLIGGTMTGPLILAADPTVALGAATKQYVETPTRLICR
jgi:hypothetical protein